MPLQRLCIYREVPFEEGPISAENEQLNITATKKMLYISMRLFPTLRFGTRKHAV